MKLLSFYKWIAGSMADFTSQFKDNEVLFNQARAYWSKLEASSVIVLVIFLVLGIAMAISYYQPYNNSPGRHYKPIHWLYFLCGTFVLTFLLTWCYVHFAVPSSLNGVSMLHLKLALGNALYAAGLYFFCSWIWCQFNLPTNACRIFKF